MADSGLPPASASTPNILGGPGANVDRCRDSQRHQSCFRSPAKCSLRNATRCRRRLDPRSGPSRGPGGAARTVATARITDHATEGHSAGLESPTRLQPRKSRTVVRFELEYPPAREFPPCLPLALRRLRRPAKDRHLRNLCDRSKSSLIRVDSAPLRLFDMPLQSRVPRKSTTRECENQFRLVPHTRALVRRVCFIQREKFSC
jgi:hypothetical protein